MNNFFFSNDKNILFYDATCKFCISCAFFLKRRTKNLYFFALQSTFTRHFFEKNKLDIADLETICLWKNQKMYQASEAVLRSFFFSNGYWIFFARITLFFPRFLRDKIYFFIARRRICSSQRIKE